MNVNVQLEGEEDQALQYVNRFAINLPTGATAFNLNIVNSGLGNQSYILNPVSPVGQNLVAYQPPVAVQSYFALPTEGEGNILHSLPVGVSVPVSLPVPSGLLQNHNFVNTSIIIGNDDCEPDGVKPLQNHDEELKIAYLEKTEKVNSQIEVQSMGLHCSPLVLETSKKPCPLEMSIKAANIEFDKCEIEVPVFKAKIEKDLIESIPLAREPQTDILKVPSVQIPSPKLKTEITWENSKKDDSVNFQESLICEVEEVNDDDEDVETINNQSPNLKPDSSSSEENDALPLSVALKLKKLSDKGYANSVNNKKVKISEEIIEEKEEEDTKKKKTQRGKKQLEATSSEEEWSDSDDDALNLKRIKNEFNYKCYYEPNSSKSATSIVLKLEESSEKFSRVRSCCSKKECGKKISVKDQKIAYKNFYDLESNFKRDAYLMNCIEHVPKNKNAEKENAKDMSLLNQEHPEKADERKLMVNANIQLEIENESNGNQKLSDEIQNAIKESLKDCIANETQPKTDKSVEGSERPEKNTWNFYIVIDRCKRKVCLQFLLKLFRLTKNRVKQIQKKILSGTPLTEESIRAGNKPNEIWEVAKKHLDNLIGEECLDCNANPRHRFLSESCSQEDLFVNFKKYYLKQIGREPNIKYNSYKRFLDKDTTISFNPKQNGTCAACEYLKMHPKKKGKGVGKDSNKSKTLKPSSEKGKKWVVKTDSEESSDDEPLVKRKKLKLTLPPKSANAKQGKRNGKNLAQKSKGKGSKEKSKQPISKGRDVWSLMLLHLETMPYKVCYACTNKKKHRFLDPTFTTNALFEDYRKYFLKETNSELGLGFTMYEKYFNKNCNYTIGEVDVNATICPRCLMDKPKS